MNEMVRVQLGPLVEALDPVLHVLLMIGVALVLLDPVVLLGNLAGGRDPSRDGG